MKDMTHKPGRRAFTLRMMMEGLAFTAAAALVATSAVMAKQSAHAPALAMLDRAEAPAREFVAATRAADVARVAPASAEETLNTITDTLDAEDVEFEIVELVDAEIRFFNGRAVRPAYQLTMIVTAYSPDHRSCGIWADGITASNRSVWTNGMKLVAADTRLLPFGTLLSIPGYDEGRIVPVLDRGGAIKGNRLDVLYPTHEIALKWGVQRLPVIVWEYVDGE
ncbi:MAG: hypothetical protein EA376_09840 [Phycisphaeraceae bacterium]|nr:MAG: hypothetical protein EA376_09840 [Phycisphaeraceae bacterium]